MTTIVELTDEEIAELKALTDETDTATASRKAIVEYLQYARRQRLKTLSGRIEMQENWEQLEHAELGTTNDEPRSRPH